MVGKEISGADVKRFCNRHVVPYLPAVALLILFIITGVLGYMVGHLDGVLEGMRRSNQTQLESAPPSEY